MCKFSLRVDDFDLLVSKCNVYNQKESACFDLHQEQYLHRMKTAYQRRSNISKKATMCRKPLGILHLKELRIERLSNISANFIENQVHKNISKA